MAPVIRLSDNSWERLKRWAEPLEDTPDDVVRKVLDMAERHIGCTGTQRHSSNSLHQKGEAEPQQDLFENVEDLTDNVKAQVSKNGRLPKGTKVPNEAYEMPIMETLYELGGKGHMRDVLDGVEEKMRHLFRAVEYEATPSGRDLRWRISAQWARNGLVHERGWMEENSGHGIWELTEEGIAQVERYLRNKADH